MPVPTPGWVTRAHARNPDPYTGPGDVVGSAVGWWGLRAYSAAKATALVSALNICTAADAACTDIHVTSAGALNTSDITTSGCSAISTCTVKTVYDQSAGGHNCTNATEGNRPLFDPNGYGAGKPGINYGNGANKNLACASLPTTAVPWSFVAFYNPSSAPGGNGRLFVAADPTGLLYDNTNHFIVNGGSNATSSGTFSTGTAYAVIGRTDGTGSGAVICGNNTCTTGLNAGSGST